MYAPNTQTSSVRHQDRGTGVPGTRTAVAAQQRPRTGLVVDDVLSSREKTAALMAAEGMSVITAVSYREAFWMVSVWRPDVVVIGIKEGSGDFTKKIRPLYEDPVPIPDLSQPPAW